MGPKFLKEGSGNSHCFVSTYAVPDPVLLICPGIQREHWPAMSTGQNLKTERCRALRQATQGWAATGTWGSIFRWLRQLHPSLDSALHPFPCSESQGPGRSSWTAGERTPIIGCSSWGAAMARFLPSPSLSLPGLPLQGYVEQRIRLIDSWLPLARGVASPPPPAHHGQPLFPDWPDTPLPRV